MKIKLRHVQSDSIDVVLGDLIETCKSVGLNAQKESAKAVKKAIIKNLNNIKSDDQKQMKHMCEDVHIKTTQDEYGDVVVKVQGGKATGTLWHIVNDGSYNKRYGKRNRATHFMDISLNEVEQEIESAIDEAMRKGGLS